MHSRWKRKRPFLSSPEEWRHTDFAAQNSKEFHSRRIHRALLLLYYVLILRANMHCVYLRLRIGLCTCVHTVYGDYSVLCTWTAGPTGRSQDRHTRLVVCRDGHHQLRHLLGHCQRTAWRYVSSLLRPFPFAPHTGWAKLNEANFRFCL